MAEFNSYETHDTYPNLNDQHQLRLKKINEIQYYLVDEIKETELMNITLSKYIASFDYFDKSLIVLSVSTGGIYIALFANVIGAPVEMLARLKSNSIEIKISEALINSKIGHNNIITIINEEKNIKH